MDSKVAKVAAAPDPSFSHKAAPRKAAQDGKGSEDVAKGQGPDPADLRLIIEEDKTSGSYVYKTVNRVTGEVVSQLPREDVLKLRDQADYVAGAMLRTKA